MRRSGLVAQKIGMTQIFIDKGKMMPVTLLHVFRNIVVGVKTVEKHGYNAVVLGYGEQKQYKVPRPLMGILKKLNITSVKGLKEFVVTVDYSGMIGESLHASHFQKNQYIDVVGKSIGKGFAGPMKRHNFRGLEASHGVSISHRAHGSTGQRQEPGKVFKNKKMAGHMGYESVTVQNLKVVDVDESLGVLAVLGCVPGSTNGILFLSDAIKKAVPLNVKLPAAPVI